MARLKLIIEKYAQYAQGLETAFASLTPLDGKKHKRLHALIPVSGGDPKTIELPEGEWLVEARLPSGECLTRSVKVEDGREQILELHAASSSHEWRSWPTTLSRTAAVWDRASAGSTAKAGFESFGIDDTRETQTTLLDAANKSAPDMQTLIWDRRSQAYRAGDEWASLGATRDSETDVMLDSSKYTLDAGICVFVRLKNQPAAICVPLPWDLAKAAHVQICAIPETGPSHVRWHLRAFILDPVATPILAFLVAGDLEAARLGAPQLIGCAEKLIDQKIDNPLAGALGALALLRLGEHGRLGVWPLNLADWFYWMPDGAAIASWCVLMLGTSREKTNASVTSETRARIALSYVREAARRGPPFFSDSVRLLRECCSVLRQPDCPVHGEVGDALVDWVERCFRAVQPTSFVAAYECDTEEELMSVLTPVPLKRRG